MTDLCYSCIFIKPESINSMDASGFCTICEKKVSLEDEACESHTHYMRQKGRDGNLE